MARRGENIYKRKDGRWEGRLLIQKGKYQYIYAKSYKEVKEKMRSLHDVEKISTERPFQQTESSAELLEAWLDGGISLQVKPSTYESYYRCMHKHILPFFYQDTDKFITKESVLRFIKVIREDASLAESSKKKILSIFKISLKEILKAVPNSASILELIKLPKLEIKEVQVFSLKEERLLEAAAFRYEDKRALGIILCFCTGIRLGELCALKWSDIDMDAGMMSISKTVSRTKNFEDEKSLTKLLVGTPKSRNSMRKIPLPTFLIKLVEQGKLYPKNENCYVLSGTDTPIDPRSFQKLYKKLLIDTGIQDRKFHAIRHTFATRALELGVDIKTISEILGHSNVSITLNIYAHSLIEHKKAAIEKFNSMHMETDEFSKFAV